MIVRRKQLLSNPYTLLYIRGCVISHIQCARKMSHRYYRCSQIYFFVSKNLCKSVKSVGLCILGISKILHFYAKIWRIQEKIVILQPLLHGEQISTLSGAKSECLVNLVKNKKNGKENNSSECAVYAFQHSLLRLSDCGKRARNKANCLRASISDRWTHCIPSELHYQ